jgi:hypothetical protein
VQTNITKATISKINQRPQVSAEYDPPHSSPEFPAISSDFTSHRLYPLCNLVYKVTSPNQVLPESTTDPKSLQNMFTHIDSQRFLRFRVTSLTTNFTHLGILPPNQHHQTVHLQNQLTTPQLSSKHSPSLIPRVLVGFERLHLPPTWVFWPQNSITKATTSRINQ